MTPPWKTTESPPGHGWHPENRVDPSMTRTRNLGMPIDESPDIHRAHRHPSILRTDDSGLRFLACLSEVPKCLGVAVMTAGNGGTQVFGGTPFSDVSFMRPS